MLKELTLKFARQVFFPSATFCNMLVRTFCQLSSLNLYGVILDEDELIQALVDQIQIHTLHFDNIFAGDPDDSEQGLGSAFFQKLIPHRTNFNGEESLYCLLPNLSNFSFNGFRKSDPGFIDDLQNMLVSRTRDPDDNLGALSIRVNSTDVVKLAPLKRFHFLSRSGVGVQMHPLSKFFQEKFKKGKFVNHLIRLGDYHVRNAVVTYRPLNT
jgi:hypothetical protein